MHTQFSPISHHTVAFAKSYRADQIRAAQESRVAAEFRSSRPSFSQRVRAAYGAAAARRRSITVEPQVTAEAAQ